MSMRFGSISYLIPTLLACAAVAAPAMARGDAWAGSYRADEGLGLELRPAGNGYYEGAILLGQERLNIRARDEVKVLVGTMEARGSRFEFSAEHGASADELIFHGGEETFRFKRTSPARAEDSANLRELPGRAGERASGVGNTVPAQGSSGSLKYRIEQLPGGTIAAFDGWQTVPVMADGKMFVIDMCPANRQRDFVLRVCIATPSARDLENLFTAGPQLTQQFLAQLSPSFRRTGQLERAACGGDEARVEQYRGNLMGSDVTARVMYVRRDADVALAVCGIGTEAGMREFGGSIEIMAQSITFKEGTLEPQLVGSWVSETSSRADAGGGDPINVNCTRTIAIYPNGTFTDSAGTTVVGAGATGLAEGGNRGRLVRRGNVLTFHYDNGQTWSATYSLEGGALKLDGRIYLRQ